MRTWMRAIDFGGSFHAKNGTIWVLLGILLLAFAMRVCPLGDLTRGSLDFPEARIMANSAQSFSRIAGEIPPDQAPMKYFALRPLLYLGRSEFLLRLPALVFDLASILLLFYLGSLLFDRKAALLACFFMAVSVWHIHYGSSARNYPLYIFSLLGSTIFLYRAVRLPGIREWLFYSVALAFSYYSFYWGFFFSAAQLCWFFICYGRRADLVKRFLISLGLFLVMMIPWAGRLKGALDYKMEQDPWNWEVQCQMIWVFLRDHFGGMVGPVPFGVIVFVLGFIWVYYFQKKRPQALLLLALVVIPSFLCIFCQYVFRTNIAPRYFLLAYPFFLLMAAAGIMSWRHWAVRVAGVLVFMLPLLLYTLSKIGVADRGLIPVDYLRHCEDHSAVASVIEKNYDALDFVVVEPPLTILPIQYYLDRGNQSPVMELDKGESGEKRFMYANSRITLFGLNGELPTLKKLAAAGRLLVVDLGQIAHEENRDEIFSWLENNAYKIERDYRGHGEDLYFISPPRKVSGDYKSSSAKELQSFLSEAHVLRRLTYPFNREE